MLSVVAELNMRDSRLQQAPAGIFGCGFRDTGNAKPQAPMPSYNFVFDRLQLIDMSIKYTAICRSLSL